MNYWVWGLIAVLGLITFAVYACVIVASNDDDKNNRD